METTVAPTAEPVSLAEMKRHLRVADTDTSEDMLIGDIILAARESVEGMTRRALMTQTRVLRIDDFARGDDQVIELPGGKIQSVSSITYLDEDNVSQTWSAANYVTDFGTTGGTGRVGVVDGVAWPDTLGQGLCVTITYIAGWTTAAAVPAQLRRAILMVGVDLFENRGAMRFDRDMVNPAVESLTHRWRVPRVT